MTLKNFRSELDIQVPVTIQHTLSPRTASRRSRHLTDTRLTQSSLKIGLSTILVVGLQFIHRTSQQTVAYDSEIVIDPNSSVKVVGLGVRDYHSDFFYIKQGSLVIENRSYLEGDGTALLGPFSSGEPFRILPKVSSPIGTASTIASITNICLVDKNKLLVLGSSTFHDSIIELHQLENNSATVVTAINELQATPPGSGITYIMQSCDYTGGAYFRSTSDEQVHAFYDPGTNEFYRTILSPDPNPQLITVANSKRGHFFAIFWDYAYQRSVLGYSQPANFWALEPLGINQ